MWALLQSVGESAHRIQNIIGPGQERNVNRTGSFGKVFVQTEADGGNSIIVGKLRLTLRERPVR